ncbi:MAG: CvpA family protein [Firmicutes bacterium]|nr:CvpA family protein [Bacillota bacterium]
MFADIVVGTLILLFAIIGAHTGLLRGLIKSIPTFAIVVVAIMLAVPIAGLLDGWFNWAEALSALFEGEGTLDTWARNNGRSVLIVLTAVGLFLLMKLILLSLSRFIKRLTQSNRTIGRVDRILGFFFGLGRFLVYACILAMFLSLFPDLQETLLEDSTLAAWIYDRAVDIASLVIRNVNAGSYLPLP